MVVRLPQVLQTAVQDVAGDEVRQGQCSDGGGDDGQEVGQQGEEDGEESVPDFIWALFGSDGCSEEERDGWNGEREEREEGSYCREGGGEGEEEGVFGVPGESGSMCVSLNFLFIRFESCVGGEKM